MAKNEMTKEEIARIKTALDVLKEQGMSSSYAYECIEDALPASERPPLHDELWITVDIVGHNEMSNTLAKKINKTLSLYWHPITFTHGKREITLTPLLGDDRGVDW